MKLSLTALRFEDVRQNIVDYLIENGEYSSVFDYKGSNLAYLIDVMTYVTMLINYQLTSVSNNIFLDTTEIRKNAVSIAKTMGYKPKRPISARFSGKLRYNGSNFNSSSKITILAYTEFYSNLGNIYMNYEPIELVYVGNSSYLEGNYSIYEGTKKQFTTLGTGESLQSFVIPAKNIEEYSLNIYVIDSSNTDLEVTTADQWNHAISFESIVKQNVYFVEESIDNPYQPKIVFGNGIVGDIPTTSNVIVCKYIETKGSIANGDTLATLPQNTNYYVLSDDLRNVFKIDNFDPSYGFENNISYGGKDAETLTDIQKNAPRFFATTGRAVTKNDYTSFLTSYPGMETINVIGGEELVLDSGVSESDVLGNVYITAVPKMPVNFNLAQKIYLNSDEEFKILNDLKRIAIISTKRYFYKPSYIYLDIQPYVRFAKDVSLTEQNNMKTEIYNILSNYTKQQFSELGKSFKISKLSSYIDSLDKIDTSYVDVFHYFVFNNEIFNDSEQKFIYLPLVGVRDATTKTITSYLPFVKSNIEVVDDAIGLNYTQIQDNMKNILYYSPSAEDLQRYPFITSMKPEQSTIYGSLQHSYLNRKLFNADYIEKPLLEIDFHVDGSYTVLHAYPFVDNNDDLVSPSVTSSSSSSIGYDKEVSLRVLFSKDTTDENGYKVTTTNDVGTIKANTTLNTIKVALTQINFENLYQYGINVPYTNINQPYIIQYNSSGTITIKMRFMLHNMSTIRISGKNKISEFLYQEGNYQITDYLTANVNNKEVPFTVVHNTETQKLDIRYNDDTLTNQVIGTIEENVNRFLGYVSTARDLNIKFGEPNPMINSYFAVVGSFLYDEINLLDIPYITSSPMSGEVLKQVNEKYFYTLRDDDYLIYNSASAGDIRKTRYLGEIPADKNSSLYINNKQGDIYKIDSSVVSASPTWLPFSVVGGDEIIYDSNDVDVKWKKISTNSVYGIVDARKSIPINVDEFKVKVLVNNGSFDEEPWQFRNDLTNNYYEDDYILYIPSANKWTRLFNGNRSNTGVQSTTALTTFTIPTTGATQQVLITSCVNILNNLANASSSATYTNGTGGVNCYRVVNNNVSASIPMLMTALPLSGHNIRYAIDSHPSITFVTGNVLIYLYKDEHNVHQWIMMDYTASTVLDRSTTFLLPMKMNVGETFTVENSGSFNGSLLMNSVAGDKLIYLGYDDRYYVNYGVKIDLWQKYYDITTNTYNFNSDTLIPDSYPEKPSYGDVVGISIEGDFQNSSALNSTNRNSTHSDKLIFLSKNVSAGAASAEGWYKMNKYTCYCNDTISKNLLNDLGMNSDPYIIFDTTTSKYALFFNDIFDQSVVGLFNYNTSKLLFNTNNEMVGNLNETTLTPAGYDKAKFINFFNNYSSVNRFDKIQISPVQKMDLNGNRLNIKQTDFDTLFNQYIACFISSVQTI